MLSKLNLREILENILEENYDSVFKAAKKWSEGMHQYSKDIEPISTTPLSASEKLEINLCEAFDVSKNAKAKSNSCSADMESAFSEFASDLSMGMDKSYITIPPATSVGFENLFTLPHPKTHKEAASRLATAIDNWLKTGKATHKSTGATINWS